MLSLMCSVQVFLSSLVNGVNQECRVFLLVVGLEQMLLCMLMQEGTHPPPGPAHSMHMPSVDAAYIDRGRALLLELRAQDLFSCEFEEKSSLPSLQSADSLLASLSTRLTRRLQLMSQHSRSGTASSRKLSDPSGMHFLSQEAPGDKFSGTDDDDVLGVPDWSGSSSPHRSHSMLHLKRTFRQRKLTPTQQQKALGSIGNSSPFQQAIRMIGTPHQTNS